ncbi:acyl- N-acyltransferase [Pyrrhoderma noxium]|uniref:N-alpha-acetyltransferase 40 n=1 Tax=Pyrrhoderma noxium TaxID=2282107 RepID=A0A286URE3_9AGAM|nr:acyl- N-acyltransferase [Pyrrhoderma noxium]
MEESSITDHPFIKRANKVKSSELQKSVKTSHNIKSRQFHFKVCRSVELSETMKDQIWTIFENNMKTLYISSGVFPWDPKSKKEEIFNKYSRFLLVTPQEEDSESKREDKLLAYSIFRFERDEERNAIYVYELQTSKDARRLGLGKALIDSMKSIGRTYKMSILMLTLIKANETAKIFYESIGFETDETSPDFDEVSEEEEDDEDTGYSILSISIGDS